MLIAPWLRRSLMDMNLFHQVRDLASQLQPISEAITRAQKDNMNLADACDIFFALLQEPQLWPHKDLVEKRCILPSLHWKEFFPFQHISIVTSTFKVQWRFLPVSSTFFRKKLEETRFLPVSSTVPEETGFFRKKPNPVFSTFWCKLKLKKIHPSEFLVEMLQF